jgi:hypothetical protein
VAASLIGGINHRPAIALAVDRELFQVPDPLKQ